MGDAQASSGSSQVERSSRSKIGCRSVGMANTKQTEAFKAAKNSFETARSILPEMTKGAPSKSEKAHFAGALVFACAAWEHFAEELAIETTATLAPKVSPSLLEQPRNSKLRGRLEDYSAWDFNAHGWRELWVREVSKQARGGESSNGMNGVGSEELKTLAGLCSMDIGPHTNKWSTVVEPLLDPVGTNTRQNRPTFAYVLGLESGVNFPDVLASLRPSGRTNKDLLENAREFKKARPQKQFEGVLAGVDAVNMLRNMIAHTGTVPTGFRKDHSSKFLDFLLLLAKELDSGWRAQTAKLIKDYQN